MKICILTLTVLLGVAASSFGQSEDAEGCKDSPLLTRMKSCYIETCDNKEFDGDEFQIGAVAESGEFKKKNLEGVKTLIVYRCPQSTSALQILRNAEGAFKKAGYVPMFSGKDVNDWHVTTMRKGPQWVQVTSSEAYEQESRYELKGVLVKEMEQELAANADVWAEQIAESGRCSIYGINFATGKAALQADSEPVLNEIVKMMRKNDSWKMLVEGHTDNVGVKAANRTLSQQRAASVLSWLVAHGIPATRLSSSGLGDTAPCADNSTEEGRAKNRRVDLVKM